MALCSLAINKNCDNNNMQNDIYSVIIYGAKPYARVHFGSFEWKSVSVGCLPTNRPSYKLQSQLRLWFSTIFQNDLPKLLTFESACRLL